MINTLDGLTILRFAKILGRGAGIEEHLKNLDQVLLTRNKAKIIRIYFEEGSKGRQTTKDIGQGCLVEIPMPLNAGEIKANSNRQEIKQPKTAFFKAIFREVIVYNPILYRIFFRDFLKKYYPRPVLHPIKNFGEKVGRILLEHDVNLVVMHHVGTVDSAEVIEEARKLGIPYIFINHFSNDYFSNISIREQLGDAAAIAGVTNVGVPKWLKASFYSVSTGIDTEIFDPLRAGAPGIETDALIIIYPARITRVKGQADLIKAYAKLKSEGLHARVLFAGRTDSPVYEEALKTSVEKNGLTDDVFFVGQLNMEELLDWYRHSSVMAFPTYHQEGLPRILMEAQAMKVPPVAYIIGGTPEAIQDGKTGFLVPKGDIKKFAQRLRELLTNEEMRTKMGEEGRKFVQENFSLSALAERHEKLYLSVLEKQ